MVMTSMKKTEKFIAIHLVDMKTTYLGTVIFLEYGLGTTIIKVSNEKSYFFKR